MRDQAELGRRRLHGRHGPLNIAGSFGGFETGPITDPIILQRDGRRFEYIGETTIGSGAEVRVETSRDTLSLSLTEMDDGSSVILELPGFTAAVGGTETSSLAALREAGETSWYSENGTLWVKLVVDNSAGANVQIGTPGAGVSTVGTGPGGAFDAGARLDVSRQVQVSAAMPNESDARQE